MKSFIKKLLDLLFEVSLIISAIIGSIISIIAVKLRYQPKIVQSENESNYEYYLRDRQTIEKAMAEAKKETSRLKHLRNLEILGIMIIVLVAILAIIYY